MNLIFFGVLTYAIIYVLIHQIILRFNLLEYSLFFSSTLVLTSSYRRSLSTFYLKHVCDYGDRNHSPVPVHYSTTAIICLLWKPDGIVLTEIKCLVKIWTACPVEVCEFDRGYLNRFLAICCRTGPWINTKISSHHRCGDRTIYLPYFIHNGISVADKTL